MRFTILLFILCIAVSCKESGVVEQEVAEIIPQNSEVTGPALIVLGTVQDAGSPHIACKKDCCKDLFENPDKTRKVVSLGLIDGNNTFLFEATPDIGTQLKTLQRSAGSQSELPNGIFLTHAHIGHYTGLMYLGKEATNASMVPVYVMPGMKEYLETNGPWSQLVDNENVTLVELEANETIKISQDVFVTPYLVPHRDEYSETVGYFIDAYNTTIGFIPDIDKWEKWDFPIGKFIEMTDYVFVDATFYSGEEINTRDISEIPHPFIIESMALFDSLPDFERKKIHFIHFNHTNPVLDENSEASKEILRKGYKIAKYLDVIML